MEDLRLPGLPTALTWHVPPAESPSVAGGRVTVAAGALTDLFAPPAGETPITNAPRALAPTRGDFQLLARVDGALVETFDAGALLLWSDSERWAKLALERSREGEPTIVSVVTRERSDDCNSHTLEHAATWLRISRSADACAFHASPDGATWRLIRHFAVAGWEPLAAGILVQSPRGEGMTATFSELELHPTTLAGLRGGA